MESVTEWPLLYIRITKSLLFFFLQIDAMLLMVKHRKWVPVIICALMTVVLIFLIDLLNFRSGLSGSNLLEMSNITASQSIEDSNVAAFRGRIVHNDQLQQNNNEISHRCVRANISGMSFPVCVHGPKEDQFVSRNFIRGVYWEHQFVERFIRLLRRFPDFEFIDLGANLGAFTLAAARITHVVAVEPYWKTMARLFKSVQLGGVETNVSLVFNAISNSRSTVSLGFQRTNFGGTHLMLSSTTDCRQQSCTQTILLDDLLPLMRGRRAVMKADIERHQPQVFNDFTAAKFFEQIDVPLIFMEWQICRKNSNIDPSILRDLIRFFTSRQYQMFTFDNQQLAPDCRMWPNDIIFKKQSLEF